MLSNKRLWQPEQIQKLFNLKWLTSFLLSLIATNIVESHKYLAARHAKAENQLPEGIQFRKPLAIPLSGNRFHRDYAQVSEEPKIPKAIDMTCTFVE